MARLQLERRKASLADAGERLTVLLEVAPTAKAGLSTAEAELLFGTLRMADTDATLFDLSLRAGLRLGERVRVSGEIPVAHARAGAGGGTTLGNVTAGISSILSQSAGADGSQTVSAGGSVSFPTASSEGDRRAAAEALGRFHVDDPGLYRPETTAVRLHGDYRIRSGNLSFQSQLGLHTHVIEDTDDELLLRAGLAGALHLSSAVALLSELTTISRAIDDAGGEQFLHTLDVGLRYRAGTTRFGLRVYVPLDDSLRQQQMFGVGVNVATRR